MGFREEYPGDLPASVIAFKMNQWKNDFWQWFVDCVYTVDEAQNAIRPSPPYKYLKVISDCYMKSKILVVNKTRRMYLTHYACARLFWSFLFHKYSENIVISINEDRAKHLIQSRFIPMYKELDPRFPWPVLREKEHIRVSEMINPVNGARIAALPSGSDKCRGLTVNNAVYDEFAFQKNCEENLKALKPALEGDNCRAMIISTPAFGTKFQELVTNISKDSHVFEHMTGVTEIKNVYNQNVLSVHYTANPAKRTPEWYHKERYGTTPTGEAIPGCSGVDPFTWDQEYELSFTVPTGKPVVPEFERTLHCEPYKNIDGYIEGRPLHVSFDFGTHYPAVAFMQVDSLNRCVIHDALMAEDEELEAFMVRVRDFIRQEYPKCEEFHLYADPAGKAGNSQGTAPPAIDLLQKFFKKQVRYMKSRPVDRARAIRNKMSKRVGDAMGVIIKPAAGTHIRPDGEQRHGILVEALQTGWVYKTPKEGEHYTDLEPKKDGYYDHIMDAIGYAFTFIFPTYHERAIELRTGAKKKPKPKKRYLRL